MMCKVLDGLVKGVIGRKVMCVVFGNEVEKKVLADGDRDARANCLGVVAEEIEDREVASEGESNATAHAVVSTKAMGKGEGGG